MILNLYAEAHLSASKLLILVSTLILVSEDMIKNFNSIDWLYLTFLFLACVCVSALDCVFNVFSCFEGPC